MTGISELVDKYFIYHGDVDTLKEFEGHWCTVTNHGHYYELSCEQKQIDRFLPWLELRITVTTLETHPEYYL